MQEARKKDQVITMEMMVRIRDRTRFMAAANPDLSNASITKALMPEFPQFGEKSLLDYVSASINTSDVPFQLAIEGKISLGVFLEVSRIRDEDKARQSATQDYVVNEAINRKMSAAQVATLKGHRRDGDSWFLAFKKACGEMPAEADQQAVDSAAKVIRNFEKMVDNIGDLSTKLRVAITQAVELAPMTVLDKAELHYGIFNKAYMLRHILKEQYDFIDAKVKHYLDELVGFTNTIQEMEERSKAYGKQDHDRGGSDGAQG